MLTIKVARIATLLVAVLLVAGCSSQDEPDGGQATSEGSLETSEDLAEETQDEPSDQGDESDTEESPASDAPQADGEEERGTEDTLVVLTEDDIVDALSASDLPITNLEVFDAETDPNSLLGRPGQYTVKISWEDTRLTDSLDLGGTLEVFPDVESMQRRADYVERIGQEAPMLLQWIFTDARTGAVLRVSSDLSPEQAAEYETWLNSLA